MATRPYPSFLIYIDSAGEYRWQLEAANGRLIANGGEGYKHRQGCEHAVELVQNSINYEVWETQDVTDRRR